VPYIEIVKVAIIPALMYFLVVFVFVDIIARKRGLHGIPAADLPRLRSTLAAGFHFLIPLVLLTYLLFQYVTPLRAGLYATGALLVVAMLRRVSRLDLRDIGEVFMLAARNTLTVSVATAAAGIIVGVVGLTGAGLKFSSGMLSVAAGQLLLTLIMIALASLVLGLGLPVTASYVVLIILAGPALLELGLPLIVAHMIVYWYSQDSNVTPPVALAAFSAAGIAGSSPMRTGLAAWKFAKGLYLIPLLMAYSPLLLNGTLSEIVLAVATGLVGLFAFAVALEGHWLVRTSMVERAAVAGGTVLLLTPSYLLDAVGAAVVATVVLNQVRRARKERAETQPAEGGRNQGLSIREK
jgi:TRAP transporter 4TM/12TM fusion protein